MKILITGSEGSLMQALIPRLTRRGHEVIGADSLVRYGERADRSSYEFHRGDLASREFVDGLFDSIKPTYVIQAAARVYGVGGFNRYPADILGEDVSLHNNVLRASARLNVRRVVYLSSSMIYENCIQSMSDPVKEEWPDQVEAPFTDYGLSKFVGERLSRAFMSQYGLEFLIWRPFNIITPYERVTGDVGVSHVFADFIEGIVARRCEALPIIGDGEQIRCFTWIDDVAEAIAAHSFSGRSRNEVFNLGNAEPISMKALATLIHRTAIDLQLIERKELKFSFLPAYANDVKVRVPDVTKAQRVLGFEAKKRVAQSVRECVLEAAKSDRRQSQPRAHP